MNEVIKPAIRNYGFVLNPNPKSEDYTIIAKLSELTLEQKIKVLVSDIEKDDYDGTVWCYKQLCWTEGFYDYSFDSLCESLGVVYKNPIPRPKAIRGDVYTDSSVAYFLQEDLVKPWYLVKFN